MSQQRVVVSSQPLLRYKVTLDRALDRFRTLHL